MRRDPASERHRMVEAERRYGEVHDERVFAAMEAIPRERFVPEGLQREAYGEHALPIGCDQTISQPYVVTLMTAALELSPDDRVLEIGTGSGYQAAVLRRLAAHVVTIERIAALADQARNRFEELGIDGIEVHVGDGSLGWPDAAPYDAIIVTAGGPSVPPALIDQLADGGRLVMPVGRPGAQRLVRLVRAPGGMRRDDLGAVSFVPLIGEQGWTDDAD